MELVLVINSSLLFNFLNSWCEPEPFPMISHPSNDKLIDGFSGAHNSSHVSQPISVSKVFIIALPNGTLDLLTSFAINWGKSKLSIS